MEPGNLDLVSVLKLGSFSGNVVVEECNEQLRKAERVARKLKLLAFVSCGVVLFGGAPGRKIAN